MGTRSAGLVLFRRRNGAIEVFLIHPGGPFWQNKDLGVWSIPKGEYEIDEDPLTAAKREFREETGSNPDELAVNDQFLPLTPLRQAGGKMVHAWACEGDCDPGAIKSNSFVQEWPPNSGKRATFPEVDRAAWFDLSEARRRILNSQLPLLEELEHILTEKGPTPACDTTDRLPSDG